MAMLLSFAVLVRKGFRYRIYPTAEQVRRLLAWEASLRWLWNIAHEQRLIGIARARDERRYPSAFDQIYQLPELRAAAPWLADVPSGASAQLLIDLYRAWQSCFLGIARTPRWKRKRDVLGICDPNAHPRRIVGDVLYFPKLGSLRVVAHRPLEGKPKTCTIKRDGDQWFACILCEIDLPTPAPRTEPVIALDRGIINLVATSDGELVENPRHLKASLKRLARAQRTVARRKKGSKNHKKAIAHVARIHRKVRRQRAHTLHQLSARLSKSHAIVVVEKLGIKRMSASAAGTVEVPARNVRQKAGLNRGIIDAGWGRLVEMLRYKLAWNGGQLVEVPAAYSSQECSRCGHVAAQNRRSQARFECVACGHADHADVNAAKVLKTRWRPACQPVEGSPLGARRSRKSLRMPRRAVSTV